MLFSLGKDNTNCTECKLYAHDRMEHTCDICYDVLAAIAVKILFKESAV